MKKGMKLLLIALGTAVALAGCGRDTEGSGSKNDSGGSQEQAAPKKEGGDTQEYITTAEAFAADILAGDYDKLKTGYSYTEQFQEGIESGQIKQAMEPSVKASGALIEIKSGFVSLEKDGYVNVDVPCDFEVQPWNMTVSFTGDGKITGIHAVEYKEGKEQIPEGVKESSLSLKIGGGRELPGTFTIPGAGGSYPAVVFVHGSGNADRNEAMGKLKPFQDLAWGLAQQGIASYRYDKVSYVYGQELSQDKTFTVYDETVNDAVAAVKLLRQQKGVNKVYVIGHSQGAQMMGAIAEKAQPDGCVMMAAPAAGYVETFQRQIQYLESLDPNLSEEEKKSYEDTLKELQRLKDPDSLGEDETVLGLYKDYWESILGYHAVEAAGAITAPVLVLQGEEDYQVTMDDFNMWKDAYESSENWEFRSFPGLTHLFMPGSYENGPADYQGEKHIPDEVIDNIAEFIKK